jgi:hypothetical protein
MKTKILVLIVLVFSASAICTAEQIASYDMLWQTVKHENISSCILDMYVSEDGNSSSKILNTVITPSDIGSTFTATSADPGFNDFVSYITNGVNGLMVVDLMTPGGLNAGCGFAESDVFNKPTTGISDLEGCAPISSVNLKINDFELFSPGKGSSGDLWGDGICTYVNCDFGFSVDTPEPSTMAMLITGTLIFYRKRK